MIDSLHLSQVTSNNFLVLPFVFVCTKRHGSPVICVLLLSKTFQTGVCCSTLGNSTLKRKERISVYLTCFLLSLESLLFRGRYIEFVQNSLFHAAVIKRVKENIKEQRRRAFLPSLPASQLQLFSILHIFDFLEYKLFVCVPFGEKSLRNILIHTHAHDRVI